MLNIFAFRPCHFLLWCLLLSTAEWALAAPKVPQIISDNGLIYCTNASGFSFNPQTADAGTSMNVVTEQIYNKLFEPHHHSAKVEPSLAQSYRISPDGKTITITLRKGVQFQHTAWFTPTRPLNADDVVFSLNRVLGHNTSLPEFATDNKDKVNRQYQIFHELAKKSRFPYFESVKLNQKIKQVESVDPYTVKIELFAPDASILSHLASQYAVILSQEYALQLNADDNLSQLDELPVGTGPYQVQDYFRSQYIRLQRNAHYWGKKPTIPHIVIDLSTDRIGRLAKFFNNECQIASFPEPSQLGLLKNNGERFQMTMTEGMNLSYLAFNFLRPAMQNSQIRHAIAQAINRQRIIDHIYYDTATIANRIIPPVSWASRDNRRGFDDGYKPLLAKSVLQDKNLVLEMWVVDQEQVYNPSPIKMAEMIKSDLAKVGVKVKVRSVSRNFLMRNLNNKTEDYDLILSGWLTSSLDPDSFLRPILSCNTTNEITNLSNWCSPKFDNLLDLALMNNDIALRTADYYSAQQEVLAELPIFPIANIKRLLISNTKVQGIQVTPFGNIHFEKLSIKGNKQ
ncbi:ABC transporter substrate-binding protein [Lonepinella sp. BR2271]|uniref:ABC transporter substrate-binding protein n=1 Tax=Lonepinella sp. BR2271 TaxID=3434550 RepID=UPI003F6DF735